jgi:hypothetical protein
MMEKLMKAVPDTRRSDVGSQTPARRSHLLRAAMSGLLAASAVGCPSEDDDTPNAVDAGTGALSEQELKALCSDMVQGAVQSGKSSVDLNTACVDKVNAAQTGAAAMCTAQLNDAGVACAAEQQKVADQVKTAEGQVTSLTAACEPLIGTTKSKTKTQTQKEYKFAELTKLCDDRGGYTQVAAGCGGHNVCKGFSYGDWGPGAAILTENSCAGSNACLGILCVETAKDQKRDPKAMYELEFPDPGPHHCISCHAPHDAANNPIKTSFVVYNYEAGDDPYSGAQLTLDNWKVKHTAAYQERVVAFGASGVLPTGTAYNHMAGYAKYLSRNEIAALVQYIRNDLTPVIMTVKTKDP